MIQKINMLPVFNECPCCGVVTTDVMIRRLNTAYVNDICNYLQSCESCYMDAYEYYADLWTTYYNECC